MINSAFFVLLIAVIVGFLIKDWENPLFRLAVKPVAEENVLREAARVNPEGRKVRCKVESANDIACANPNLDPTRGAVYLWGRPLAPNPRTATSQECFSGCERFGPGICVFHENGPDRNGGTSCYFISNQLCGSEGMKTIPASEYFPSQIKSMQSGRCE